MTDDTWEENKEAKENVRPLFEEFEDLDVKINCPYCDTIVSLNVTSCPSCHKWIYDYLLDKRIQVIGFLPRNPMSAGLYNKVALTMKKIRKELKSSEKINEANKLLIERRAAILHIHSLIESDKINDASNEFVKIASPSINNKPKNINERKVREVLDIISTNMRNPIPQPEKEKRLREIFKDMNNPAIELITALSIAIVIGGYLREQTPDEIDEKKTRRFIEVVSDEIIEESARHGILQFLFAISNKDPDKTNALMSNETQFNIFSLMTKGSSYSEFSIACGILGNIGSKPALEKLSQIYNNPEYNIKKKAAANKALRSIAKREELSIENFLEQQSENISIEHQGEGDIITDEKSEIEIADSIINRSPRLFGKGNDSNMTFCPDCGSNLEDFADPDFCPSCGQEL